MDDAETLVAVDMAAALPRLRRYARVLMGGPDGADELVVQTLASAWRKQRARPPEVSLPTWLFGLMHAAHRHDLRRRADPPRHASAPTYVTEEQPAPCHARAGNSGFASSDLLTRVLRLPVEEREVLMLAAVERLSYADIARLLDLPEATVMSTLTRARAHICAMESPGTDSSAH